MRWRPARSTSCSSSGQPCCPELRDCLRQRTSGRYRLVGMSSHQHALRGRVQGAAARLRTGDARRATVVADAGGGGRGGDADRLPGRAQARRRSASPTRPNAGSCGSALGDAAASSRAVGSELLAAATDDDGDVTLLVAPMVARPPRADRRAWCAIRSSAPTVMFGVGGVLAEAVGDVVFRPAPLDAVTAEEMIDSLASPVAARRGPRRGGGLAQPACRAARRARTARRRAP